MPTYEFPEVNRSLGYYDYNLRVKVAYRLAQLRGYSTEEVQLPGQYPEYKYGGTKECWFLHETSDGKEKLTWQNPLTQAELDAVTIIMDPATAGFPVMPGYGVGAAKSELHVEDIYEVLPQFFVSRTVQPPGSSIMLFGHDPTLPGIINRIIVLYNKVMGVQDRKNTESAFAALIKWVTG